MCLRAVGMAAFFAVSRVPVREALRHLAGERPVEYYQWPVSSGRWPVSDLEVIRFPWPFSLVGCNHRPWVTTFTDH